MSALSVDFITLAPLAVLSASLVGSAHCVGMCGALVTAFAPTARSNAAYQAGRLLSYAALGAGFGAIGEKAMSPALSGTLPYVSAVMLGLLLMIAGARMWNGSAHGAGFGAAGAAARGARGGLARAVAWVGQLRGRLWMAGLRRVNRARGGAVTVGRGAAGWSLSLQAGALSALLPCGWLYSFALGSAATQSAWKGTAFMAVFWLGTVPALTVAPALANRVLRPIGRRFPHAAAVLLIAAGIFTMASKLAPAAVGMGGHHSGGADAGASAHGAHGGHSCH